VEERLQPAQAAPQLHRHQQPPHQRQQPRNFKIPSLREGIFYRSAG